MSNLVIVAIPDENDRVWKVSSEKIPHLTLLFLGDSGEVSKVDQITQFVEHAANTTLSRFWLPVDRRGELGADKADVLFFKRGRYDYKAIRDFRVQLLKDNNIRTAYDTAEQREGPWLPHLTLGYPDTPAKPDETDRDYGFYDVAFTKIAVWVDNFDGPEFLLKDYWDEWDTMESAPIDIAMSDASEAGAAHILEHYGVKGMRWGQRKGEERKGWLDPEGRDLGSDVTKSAIGIFVPPVSLLTLPANIRLGRALGRHLTTAHQEKTVAKEDAKFEKVAKSKEGFVAIHNGSLEHANRAIVGLNKKYPQDLTKDPAAKKKYDAEVLKAMQSAYRDSANRITNKRGDKHLDVEFHNDGQDFSIKVKEGAPKPTVEKVKHAATIDDNDVVTFSGTIKRASTGHILGFAFDDFDEAGAQHSAAEDGAEFMVYNGLMTPDEFLEHFGVKGMRWGVRKEDVTGAAKSVGNAAKSAGGAVGKAAGATSRFVQDVNFENRLDNEKGQAAVQQAVSAKAKSALKRTDLPAIKDKPEYQKAKKLPNRLRHPRDPATKAYRKEVKQAYIKRLEEAANSMTNASGTRQYTVRERGWELPAEGGALPKSKYYYGVTSREIKHAVNEITTWHELIMDDDGFITDITDIDAEPSEPTLAQSALEAGAEFLSSLGFLDEADLEHYGVKGMHWGQRRAAPTAVTPTGTSRVPHGSRRKTQIDVAGGENHPAHEDAVKVAEARAKLKKSGVTALSNNELQGVAKRLQLETQVAQLTSSRGSKFIQRQLEQQGQQTVQTGVRTLGPKVIKKGAKKAGKVAATGAVGLALL